MSAAEGGGGPSGDVELDPVAAASISGCHQSAAGRITGQAASVPTVDGGYGTADLNLILSKVLSTADDLALINEAAAAQVSQVSTHFTGTDAAIASMFGQMDGTSWPYGGQGNDPLVPGAPPWGTP